MFLHVENWWELGFEDLKIEKSKNFHGFFNGQVRIWPWSVLWWRPGERLMGWSLSPFDRALSGLQANSFIWCGQFSTLRWSWLVLIGCRWSLLYGIFQWVSCLVSSHSVFSEAAEGKGRSRGAAWSRFRSTSAEKLLVALQNAKRKLLQLCRPGWGCWTKRIQRQQRCRVADFSQGLQSIECN